MEVHVVGAVESLHGDAHGRDVAHDVEDVDLGLGVGGPELVDEVDDIRAVWRDDLVSFALGCSFSFEQALIDEAAQKIERL